eukprot:scpid106888/ scgid9616/ 
MPLKLQRPLTAACLSKRPVLAPNLASDFTSKHSSGTSTVLSSNTSSDVWSAGQQDSKSTACSIHHVKYAHNAKLAGEGCSEINGGHRTSRRWLVDGSVRRFLLRFCVCSQYHTAP